MLTALLETRDRLPQREGGSERATVMACFAGIIAKFCNAGKEGRPQMEEPKMRYVDREGQAGRQEGLRLVLRCCQRSAKQIMREDKITLFLLGIIMAFKFQSIKP